jgi:hypothetical protein
MSSATKDIHPNAKIESINIIFFQAMLLLKKKHKKTLMFG